MRLSKKFSVVFLLNDVCGQRITTDRCAVPSIEIIFREKDANEIRGLDLGVGRDKPFYGVGIIRTSNGEITESGFTIEKVFNYEEVTYSFTVNCPVTTRFSINEDTMRRVIKSFS